MTADSVPVHVAGRLSLPGIDSAVSRRSWSPWHWVGVLSLTVVLLVLVRILLVQSFVIPSTSMEPGLQVGDRVLVWRPGSVQRGDVVVFDGAGVFSAPTVPPASGLARLGRALASSVGVPIGERDYVKRVIGLPGDRVVCCTAAGLVTVNGQPLREPYLMAGDAPSALRFDVVVPAGKLWLMGDHRSVSGDSRSHLGDPGGGMVPLGQVIGRVVSLWWPLDRATGVGRVDPLAVVAP